MRSHDLFAHNFEIPDPLPESEFLERQQRLLALMQDNHIEGILLFGANARYISGYNPLLEEVALTMLSDGQKFLFPGPECLTLAFQQAKGFGEDRILMTSDTMISGEGYPYDVDKMKPLSEILEPYKALKWGVADLGNIPKSMLDNLTKALGELLDATELLEQLRRIKSPLEIEQMRASYLASSIALNEGIKLACPGIAEYEIAGQMAKMVYAFGIQQLSEVFMVASGPNTAPCISRPSTRELVDGDLLILDIGAVLNGYYSDTGRTIVVGNRRDPKTINALRVAHEAFEAAFQKMGPGVSGKEVDKVARQIVEKYYPANMTYQIAHSVGVTHCESPHCQPVGPYTNLVLEPGMVFALDLGIWNIELGGANGVPGYVGGIRLEDGVVITSTGAERLTVGLVSDPPRETKHNNYK
jgi:Xaa-Pro aminopeptidase